jgi:pyruvyl transferase EpsO
MQATGARDTHGPHEVAVNRLRDRIDATLRPLLGTSRTAALVDFPGYANVGDSAIWLGELAYLRSVEGMSLKYYCDNESYSRQELARRLGDGVILLSGGGNLGDLWQQSQRLRERVIQDFPDTPIVQLPQSIYFHDRGALLRAKGIFDSHPGLTLLVRDARSLTLARTEFRNPAHLCPDMAFGLGRIDRPCPPTREIVWLSRTDQESATLQSRTVSPDLERVDWLDEPQTALRRLKRVFDLPPLRNPWSWTRLDRVKPQIWELLARQRLVRGCRLLSAGRVVVTDRLHGHVLSVLLGIPHVLLDNSTGKVRSFYETWTYLLPTVRLGATLEEAMALARTMAAETEAPALGAPAATGQ